MAKHPDEVRRTTYEWVVEQMDGDEIVDTSGFETLEGARKFAGPDCVISLRRDVGSQCEGITDRQEAYAGDTEFNGGAKIPQHLLEDFLSL